MEFDKISKRFYEDNFKISTDRLKAAWQYGEDFESFLMKTENLAWKLEQIYLENYEYDNLVGIYSTLSDLFNTAAEKSAIPDVTKRYSSEHKYWSEKAKGLSSRVSMEKLQSDLHKQVEEDLQHKDLDAALDHLNERLLFGIGDKWMEVECPDGRRVKKLKNVKDALAIYIGEWEKEFKQISSMIRSARRAEPAYYSLDQLDNSYYRLADRYKTAYLIFDATPCDEVAHERKRKMDRALVSALLNLQNFKTKLMAKDKIDFTTLDKEIREVIDRIDKLTT